MGNGSPIHGREGILYLSTASGSTNYGVEVGYSNGFNWTPTKEQAEIKRLNQNSVEYVEGLISGTLNVEGSMIPGNAQLRTMINRFARLSINDTGGGDTDYTAITDGTMYFHGVLKPIDTKGTSDDANGIKIVVPILASGLNIGASGGDIESWSYDGTQNGDVLYVESTSTLAGLPKKVY